MLSRGAFVCELAGYLQRYQERSISALEPGRKPAESHVV